MLTNSSASVTERDSYDSWGRRRNPNGTDNTGCTVASQTTRGYTDHEMMDSVCQVNLNARVYDPTIARVISPDPVVPDAYDGQSYNRCSYVNNTPLDAIDPSGYEGTTQDGIEGVTVTVPAYSGADVNQDPDLNTYGYSAPNPLQGGMSDPGDSIETVVVTGQKRKTSSQLPPPNQGGDLGALTAEVPSIETVVVTVQRTHPHGGGYCNHTLVSIGNWLEGFAAQTDESTFGAEMGGLAVAGIAGLGGQPEVSAAAVDYAGQAALLGVVVGGGSQIIGGFFQWAGGAGASNIGYGAITSGIGLGLGVGGRLAVRDASSVSARASNMFARRGGIIVGGAFDAYLNQIQQLGPQQLSCP